MATNRRPKRGIIHGKKRPRPANRPKIPVVPVGAMAKPVRPPRSKTTEPPRGIPPRPKRSKTKKSSRFHGKLRPSKSAPHPAKKPGKPRWKSQLGRPEGLAVISEKSLPEGVEAIIDLTEAPGIYRLNRATAHLPDHANDEEHSCLHPRNASSWFSCIGLVVLQAGGLGLLFQTWKGTIGAWIWNNDDWTIAWYLHMRSAPSKGKFVRGKFGPSYLWHQPYVLLAGR